MYRQALLGSMGSSEGPDDTIPEDIVGIPNQGNTCYINSILQLLASSPLIRQGMAPYSHLPIVAMILRRDIPALRRVCGFDHSQQDAQEFFVKVLDAIHGDARRIRTEISFAMLPGVSEEGLRRVREALRVHSETLGLSFVDGVFMGVLLTFLLCPQCSHRDIAVETFNTIQLDPSPTLLRAFETFLKAVKVEDSRCDHCGGMGRVKQSVMVAYPKVLVVHVMKWGERRGDTMQFTDRLQFNGASYRLRGFVEHFGPSTHGGHYVCTVSKGGQQWYEVDDGAVVPTTPKDFGAAYMILFDKE